MQGTLYNPLYIRLQAGFTSWLRILNFEPSSPRDMPKMLTEFLIWLQDHNCHRPHDIQQEHLKRYLEYLHERPSKTAAGAISLNYIRKHLQVIRKFSRYLTESGQESFTVKLRIKGKSSNVKCILTPAEISSLYEAVNHRPAEKNQRTHGLAKEKLTLIFTLTNVLYNAQKAQAENPENSEKSAVANTIMVLGSMIR